MTTAIKLPELDTEEIRQYLEAGEKYTQGQMAYIFHYCQLEGQRPRHRSNRIEAARRAGYKDKSSNLRRTVENLSRLPKITNSIERFHASAFRKVGADAQWLLQKMVDEVDADLADIIDPTTQRLIPVHEMPDAWRKGKISSIKYSTLKTTVRKGDDDEQIREETEMVEVKLKNSDKVLEMIGKHIDIGAFIATEEAPSIEKAATSLQDAAKIFAFYMQKAKSQNEKVVSEQ